MPNHAGERHPAEVNAENAQRRAAAVERNTRQDRIDREIREGEAAATS
jgi:hypothetical protein